MYTLSTVLPGGCVRVRGGGRVCVWGGGGGAKGVHFWQLLKSYRSE